MSSSTRPSVTRFVPDLVVTDHRRARRNAARIDPFTEVGTTGLRQYGGFVLEEWLAQLQGRRGAWVWREMLDNDPVVGAIMFAIRWLARSVEWRVAGGESAAAELVETAMHDMSETWGDAISEILSFLPYGWSFHELTYKRRLGEQPERPVMLENSGAYTSEDDSHIPTSRYSDGLIGWRKMPVRAQETLLRWGFDGYSGLSFMEQIDWHGGDHRIPIQKAILFRAQATRGNPEGRSILRNAYVPYHNLKNIRQIEAIGIERDLAGIPVATPPEGVDLFAAGNSDLLGRVQQLVTQIRRDEYEGVVLPSAGWRLELLSSGGSRQFDTDRVVRRYRQDIALSMLADFVLLGQDAVGSYAMVEVKSDMFGVALDGILDLVCEVFNRYAIPRLLRLNGMSVQDPPEIHHGSARKIDLDRVGSFLQAISLAGAPIPWSTELLKALFADAGLPADFDEHTPPTRLPVAEEHPKREVVEPPDATPPNPVPEPVGKRDKRTVAVDFDGVIRRKGPHKRPAEGKAVPGARAGLRELAQQHHVVILTARANLGKVRGWLKAHALGEFADAVTNVKPQADVYLDDRAQRFTGWPAALEKLAKADPAPDAPSDALEDRLRAAHQNLSRQLEREILAALNGLGEAAAAAYQGAAVKARRGMLHRLVSRVVRALNLERWVAQTLTPILRNHAGRVTADTQRVVQAAIRGEVRIAEEDAERIVADAGGDLGVRDIEPQVRESILRIIEDALAHGEGPNRTADRIRQMVPAGRFVNAGAGWRARLIARDQTARMQRAAALAAYRSNAHVTHVRVRDGIYGPPRSDEQCIGRDGETVPIADAGRIGPLHPLCTLSYLPVVSAAKVRRPAAVAA